MYAKCEEYHVPVLLKETVDGLDIKPGGIYVDLTFGGGGHSREILRRLQGTGHLYSFDQDQDAQQGARSMESEGNFTFIRSNFRFLRNWMLYYGHEQVDGILADLGVSSHHLDEEGRGFSFRFDAPLDMRMNQRANLTAQRIIADYSEEALSDILYLYGELKNSRRIASAIVKARQQQPVTTTKELVEVLRPLMGYDREKKDLARVFQALRIEVNGEMLALRQMLAATTEVLRPGGRLSVLTYHSLEDRMVKNIIKAGNIEGKVVTDLFGRSNAPLEAVNRSVIIPSAEEQNSNPRSRSAKLRVAKKKEQ
ncbi:MAG: 16S rRNA (cytosine(1402)-N(4))-methyltransferase RsmH [Bacteroidaceae bacterium]|jgi:16S rRNA (cytosine1402-N4)-methyltransferase|nr:16S rRNA (cytosine(1402)-N(4))-methyltransferase RsmH [Bacteroidaceae bacterium]MBQ2301529.1 16S rRNA (cytosine(1402)-N(4))-methyltransferase RsmH [Bacteroidaceae bacterium]MBR4307532.1 16S rRNA (cytosine(1402)-N(4))-methyltransferase RsmH [Bacteroidaceae bacterium]MEE1310085.1 16S rRNA (cytosine(1402)-N(4))-methyltransferase RsmH [Bacteroidaceae bacterium]